MSDLINMADIEDALAGAKIGGGTPEQARILADEVERLRGACNDLLHQADRAQWLAEQRDSIYRSWFKLAERA